MLFYTLLQCVSQTVTKEGDLINLVGSFFLSVSTIIQSYALGQNYSFKRGSSQAQIFSVLHQSTGNVKKLGTHHNEQSYFTGSKQSTN